LTRGRERFFLKLLRSSRKGWTEDGIANLTVGEGIARGHLFEIILNHSMIEGQVNLPDVLAFQRLRRNETHQHVRAAIKGIIDIFPAIHS
jgi:hypothetical protein